MPELKLDVTIGGDAPAVIAATKANIEAAKSSTVGLTTALKDTGKAAKDLANDANKATEIFRKGIGGSEMAEKVRDISKGLEIWGNAANTTATRQQALAGAVGIGIRVASGYAAQLVQLAGAMREASAAAATERDQLVQLHGTFDGLNAAAAGTLTAESALAAQRQVGATGLRLSNEQMRVAVETARELTATEGGTLESNLSVVTDAMSGQAAAAAHLGVSARSGSDAVQQLSARLATHGPIARSAAEDAASADRGMARFGQTLLSQQSFLGPLITGYSALGHALDGLNGTRQTYATVEEAERARDVILAQQRQGHATEVERIAQSYATAQTAAHDLATAVKDAAHAGDDLTRALRPGENLSDRLNALRASISTAAMGREQNRELRRLALADGTIGSRSEIDARLGTGGGSSNNSVRDAMVAASEALRDARASGMSQDEVSAVTSRTQRFAGSKGQTGEGQAAYLTRLAAQYREAAAASTAAATAEVADLTRVSDAEGAHQEVVGAEEQAFRDRNQAIQDFTASSLAASDVREAQRQDEIAKTRSYSEQMQGVYDQLSGSTQTSAQRMSGAISSTLSTMEGAFKQHLGAVIEGNESGIEAAKAFTHQVLLEEAEKAAVLTVEEAAAGVAMIARGAAAEGADPGADTSAAAHFASAGMYLGIAGASGLGAYATNPVKPPSFGSGGLSAHPATVTSAGPGGGNTTINYSFDVHGSYIDTPGFRRLTLDAVQHAARNDELPPELRG